jgi:hypothetical protein
MDGKYQREQQYVSLFILHGCVLLY